MTVSTRVRLGSSVVVLLVLAAAFPAAVSAQAIIGTVSGSNQAIVFPSPGTGLPSPTQNVVPGGGAGPHGVGYFGSDNAMVSDFGASKVRVIQISTATVLATIDTTGKYDGTGSIAIAPGLTAALAMGTSATLAVIRAPFNASSTIDTVTLPSAIAGYQTEAIVFNAAGRAFVYHTTGVSVLDPPYSSVAFTIPVAGNGSSGSIAITPDGNTILCSLLFTSTVRIFSAPFSAASTPVNLTTPTGFDGMMSTPDGSKVLAVSASTAGGVYAISAPYNASSNIQLLPVSSSFGTFEDVGISADGQLAIVAGNGGGNAATPFIQAPFTTAGATVSNVTITGGRGNGAVRFLPPGLAPGLTISKSGPPTTSTGAQITYTITYGNTGSVAANNVVIKDPVPAGTTFVSATNGGTNNAGVVTWNIGTVNAGVTGQTVQFTVTVTATGGSIDNVNYTVEGTGIPPIPGPPVSSTIGGQVPTATPTVVVPTATPTATPTRVSVVVPTVSNTGLALLVLGLAAAALLLLKR